MTCNPALVVNQGSNPYVLYNNCQNIPEPILSEQPHPGSLWVLLEVTEAMTANVSPSWTAHESPTPNGGFVMQLNAYGPPDPSAAWKQPNWGQSAACLQFWLTIARANIHPGIEIWGPWGAPGPIFGPQGFSALLPKSLPSNTLPIGYILGISLETVPTGNITSVNYSVTDNTPAKNTTTS